MNIGHLLIYVATSVTVGVLFFVFLMIFKSGDDKEKVLRRSEKDDILKTLGGCVLLGLIAGYPCYLGIINLL